MTQDYPKPIAPPPEVTGEWWIAWDALDESERPPLEDFIATRAAQWGADQELEACIAWFDTYIPGYELVADRLRAARRPKPPSLKEQALAELQISDERGYLKEAAVDTIRRALEALPE